jgi:hypothetical protein
MVKIQGFAYAPQDAGSNVEEEEDADNEDNDMSLMPPLEQGVTSSVY